VVVTDARIASQVLGNDEVSSFYTPLCQTRRAATGWARRPAPCSRWPCIEGRWGKFEQA